MPTGVRLFNRYDLRMGLETHRQTGEHEIATLPPEDLLPEAEPSVLERLVEKYRAHPLELVPDGISVEQEDAQVDVSHDRGRVFRNPGPHYIPGQRVSYYVEYSGDKSLWQCQPSAFTPSPPVASKITDTELVFEFIVPGTDISATKRELDEELGRIRQYLTWVRGDVDQYNDTLMPAFRAAIARRREAAAKTQAGIEALGVRIRKKPDTPVPPATSAPATAKKASTKGGAFEYDVALSFAGEDRAYVAEVAAALKAAKVKVFYDEYETAELWGKNLADHLGEVYGKRSRFVVLFLSQYYPLKSWPEHERQSAQARAIRDRKVVLLPARFDDTEIPGLPSTVGYINLRKTTPGKLADLILQKLKAGG
jgi:hypothetical protein